MVLSASLIICCVSAGAPDASRDNALKRAQDSVQAATAKADADPSRPVYHFRPPALWMNDPNGTIFHNGYYHVFYQHNPYDDKWGHMHWGHARSKDLLHWEHLPIALWPSEDKGEGHVFSGCAHINGGGVPMLFYTSVSTADRKRPNEQWAAIGAPDMIAWEKHPNNPMLAQSMPGLPEIGPDWRDPFIFSAKDRTFLVCGADTKDEAIIPIFEAANPQLDKWDYKGIIYRQPKSVIQFFECPNFFPLDNKWVLIFSPYKPLQYMVGAFDIDSLKFTPEKQGTLDCGAFYASNIFQGSLEKGAPKDNVLVGWVRGFKEGLGWNGCMSLPRVLSIGPDGYLRQAPIPAWQQLIDYHASSNSTGSPAAEEKKMSNTAELDAIVSFKPGAKLTIDLTPQTQGSESVHIEIDDSGIHLDDLIANWPTGKSPAQVTPRIFIDRSVLEFFVNDGAIAVTKVVDFSADGYRVNIKAENGASITESGVHAVTPIWPTK